MTRLELVLSLSGANIGSIHVCLHLSPVEYPLDSVAMFLTPAFSMVRLCRLDVSLSSRKFLRHIVAIIVQHQITSWMVTCRTG